MNKAKRIAFGIGIVLAVLVAFTAPAAADAVAYFEPDPSTVSVAPGENVTIQLMLDVNASESGIRGFQVGVDYDSDIVNITVEKPTLPPPYELMHWWMLAWHAEYVDDPPGPLGTWFWLTGASVEGYTDAGNSPLYPALPAPIGIFTIEGVGGGTSPLNFTFEYRIAPKSTIGDSRLFDCTNDMILPVTWNNGTIECTGSSETFKKELVKGWNLISLPLTPLNKSTSAVLGNDTIVYDAVYRYSATSKLFEDVTTGTMDPGLGYFVNVTTAGTWSYEGTTYTSLDIPLKKGLNMVGWLNCSKQISGNLTSIAGKYNYSAQWNTGYEIYEPHAPEVFNDFEMMDRGNGYWITAKADCTLTESCSG